MILIFTFFHHRLWLRSTDKAAYVAGCAHCDHQDYAEALALNPNHAPAHHGKGLALKRLQRHEEAISALRSVWSWMAISFSLSVATALSPLVSI
jgi:hypothetical protein